MHKSEGITRRWRLDYDSVINITIGYAYCPVASEPTARSAAGFPHGRTVWAKAAYLLVGRVMAIAVPTVLRNRGAETGSRTIPKSNQ